MKDVVTIPTELRDAQIEEFPDVVWNDQHVNVFMVA